jgi:membrane associated rhomboid family serine protease
MLILPIAQEDNTVRRTPWVSYVLIALNFVVFLLVALLFQPDAKEAAFEERVGEALTYLFRHPYLEAPPGLLRYAPKQAREELQNELQEVRSQTEPPSQLQVDRETAELQGLVQSIDEAWHQLPARRFGYVPSESHAWAILSSMFMHGGWLHLLGNMLFLFLSGPFVEDKFGRPLFAALYLISGIVATLTFSMHHGESIAPLVGASGAIAGVMGAFLIRLGAQRIRFLIIPIIWMPHRNFKVFLPAYVVLPLWLVQQVWYAHSAGEGSGVAWWAHIGGFVFGAIAAGIVRLTGIEESWIDKSIEREISIVQHPGLEKAIDARAAGDLNTAKREIRSVLLAEPNNVDAWTESYEIAVAGGDTAEAGRTAQRLLEMYTRSGEKDLAWHLISDACERVTAAELPVRFLMAAAGFLEKQGDGRTAIEMYDQVTTRSPQDPAAFRAWFRCGELLRQSGDARGARAAYQQARQHPSCVDPQLVDRALAQLERS